MICFKKIKLQNHSWIAPLSRQLYNHKFTPSKITQHFILIHLDNLLSLMSPILVYSKNCLKKQWNSLLLCVVIIPYVHCTITWKIVCKIIFNHRVVSYNLSQNKNNILMNQWKPLKSSYDSPKEQQL